MALLAIYSSTCFTCMLLSTKERGDKVLAKGLQAELDKDVRDRASKSKPNRVRQASQLQVVLKKKDACACVL